MNNQFTEEYFKSNNYLNYLSKKERYIKTADEIYHILSKFSLIDDKTKILDYGCSVGFLMQGLDKAGCQNVFGYDISEWATAQAKSSGCNILETPEGLFDLGIFLDVLEHMTDQQILDLFEKIKVKNLLVRIPCSIESNPRVFHLEVSRKDETHINCKTDIEWISFFKNLGYKNHFRLNLNTIYDSDGCFCCIFV
jgi:cyclopropane fatty-acyl-phospholipid synthase-like methyltransferase